MNRIAMIYYKVGTVIMNLMVLNILWIVHTLLGGIILGIGPSTLALFAMVRKIHQYGSVPYRKYFEFFKQYFKLGNQWLWLLITLGYFLTVQYRFLSINDHSQGLSGQVAFYLTIVLIFIVLNIVIVTPAILVHFELTFKQVLKWAIHLLAFHPYLLFFSIILCLINIFSMNVLPAIYFFIGITTNAMIIYKVVSAVFKQYEKNKEVIK